MSMKPSLFLNRLELCVNSAKGPHKKNSWIGSQGYIVFYAVQVYQKLEQGFILACPDWCELGLQATEK